MEIEARFTLGTPEPMLPFLVRSRLQRAAGGSNAAALAADQAGDSPAIAPAVELESEVSRTLAAMPEGEVTRISVRNVTTRAGITMTGSGSFGPITKDLKTKPIATQYKWEFGDGTVLTTQSPTVTHDYFPAIQAGKVAHQFDVRCTIEHDSLTVVRTLVLCSAYGLCRRQGAIVPHVTGDVFATFQHVGFSGSMIVHNIESQALTLEKMAIVALSDDPTADLPAPQFKALKNPITIKAHSAVGIGVYLSLAQLRQMSSLGPNVSGFTVYYSGRVTEVETGRFRPVAAGDPEHLRLLLAQGGPVAFSYTFRIALTDSGMASSRLSGPAMSSDWDLVGALRAITAVATDPSTGVSKPGEPVADPVTNTVAIPLSANVADPGTLAQVRSSVQAGMTTMAISLGALTPDGAPLRTGRIGGPGTPRRPDGPPLPGPVKPGEICDPDNISDADANSAHAQQLVCQLTNESHTYLMPASFQNAQKGDVILSPGGDGADQIIAALLRALTPPQYHSHSGMMTKNFVEITHCTAAADRMGDYTTGIGGAGGIQPDVLQYGWPGSITQSIDAATNGEDWVDPKGRTYTIGGFTSEALGITTNGHFILIPPLVIKPWPENEQAVRPTLRKVAETAQSKGASLNGNGQVTYRKGCYYSFYGYTKPEVSAGFVDVAGSDAGWAQGMSPAVCSSFVWICMKANNVPLVTSHPFEMPADLSPAAVAQGAQVGAGTLDGLFFYPKDERQQAAQCLDQIFENQVLNKEEFFKNIPIASTLIAGNIADQILNAFAFGDPNKYGSEDWQNSGDANAVSPDNIPWWNRPVLGHVECLQYLQWHTEQYTVSRWTKVISRGKISGTVTRGGAAVKGAYVYVYEGKSATCNSSGHYELADVPLGSYTIKAQVVVGPTLYSARKAIQLTAANPNLTVNLALETLPVEYRRLDLLYQWSCDHGDGNPFHAHGWRSAGPDQQSIPLGPGQVTNGCTMAFDYDDGSYFRVVHQVNAVLAQDLSINVTITAIMRDADSGDEQGQQSIHFNVPLNGQFVWELDIKCEGAGYHNGPSKFTGTATNNQETS